jgi:hypothetical protein
LVYSGKLLKSDSLTKIWLTAHFAELTIVRTEPNCCIVQRNGEAQDAYSSENEVRGMDVHLGVEGSNSNGHGEEIDKEGNMMKIIEKLQKDVQTHRADNKKLMKAREQQGEFNIKLMQSLERIENKLDKESGSSKSGSQSQKEQKVIADITNTPRFQ